MAGPTLVKLALQVVEVAKGRSGSGAENMLSDWTMRNGDLDHCVPCEQHGASGKQ